jgi:hypothetical protein
MAHETMTRFDLDPHAPSDLAIRSILDGLAHVVGEAERKWGIGRLRLLVDDTLRARFDRQARLLDQAIEANLEAEIRLQAEAMKRAYAALDKVAAAAGAKPLAATVWECVIPATGEVVGIVRTEADLAACQRGTAFTLDEIGRLLSGLPSAVATIKAAWPAARVERAGPMDWQRGDELPPELRA